MSDNLKDDIQNAVPVNKKGDKSIEPNFKEPQYILHCLTNFDASIKDDNKEKDQSSDKK